MAPKDSKLPSSHPVVTALMEQTSDAVMISAPDGRVTHVSAAASALLGWPREALVGGTGCPNLTWALTSGAPFWQGPVEGLDGQRREVAIVKSHAEEDGLPVAMICRLGDVLSGVSGKDALTHLPDRTIFVDRLQQGIFNAARVRKSLAMMLLGVDRLSLVNEGLGHGAGNILLLELSERLKHCVRVSDTVARLEGDHFGLILAISAVDDSVLVAEKVFQALRKPFIINDQEVTVTVSIGIGLYPNDSETAEDLIHKTESALGFAKHSGRNQYQFASSDMNSRARKRLDLENRIRRALINNEFVAFYQPKVNVDTSMVAGAEALVRWQDPERGMISPGEFITVAEETGLIEGIGSFVLREACRQTAAWIAAGLPALKMSVNVSARQFRARGLVDEVTGVLAETGLAASLLELEITESMLMENVDQVVAKMQALRDLGVGLSIDDFGTGYSSLSYLARFPITTLKIDRAFIHDVQSNSKAAEIARAIIGLSKGLELDIVAEGAEVVEHIHFLRAHGCGLVQGFYYSRPLPAKEFEQLVRRGPLRADSASTGTRSVHAALERPEVKA